MECPFFNLTEFSHFFSERFLRKNGSFCKFFKWFYLLRKRCIVFFMFWKIYSVFFLMQDRFKKKIMRMILINKILRYKFYLNASCNFWATDKLWQCCWFLCIFACLVLLFFAGCQSLFSIWIRFCFQPGKPFSLESLSAKKAFQSRKPFSFTALKII